MRERAAWALVAVIVLSGALSGCGAAMRRRPLAEPMWTDADTDLFGPPPEEWYSPYIWDGADNSVFRPLAELWRLELDREAIDVNAVDEVPSSSWFTNRLSLASLPPDVVAMGACGEVDPGVGDDEIVGPFTITRGKPDGASPGFFVRDARGVTYLMKPDGGEQAGRWAASDTLGAAVFWAAGFYTPCNRVAYARRDEFVLEEGAQARYTNGRREPLTQEVVERILDRAAVTPDGRLRFGLSQFVEGAPISPWRYEGTWDDDPNDVVPHEHRRELRGMYVLASWLDHIDSRQENTLASFVEVRAERGYVRHYVIDFSDTLGILHPNERLSERFGHSGYFDVQHMIEDLFTLGAIRRPWDDAREGPAGAVLGYYDVDHYVPDQWRPGYPNPAFDRMTERDAAWMARILARFGDDHVRALVARARFEDPVVARELERVLIGRRDRALRRWLGRISPLSSPQLDARGRACAEDLALSAGIREAEHRSYEARAVDEDGVATEIEIPLEIPEPGLVCVELPRDPGASDVHPAYRVVEVRARTEGRLDGGAMRIHAYHLGQDDLRIVGIERLDPER